MTEFDKLVAAQRLIDLYAERGESRTEEGVLQEARTLAKRRGWSLEKAIDSIEDLLLSHPAKGLKEDWSSDD